MPATQPYIDNPPRSRIIVGMAVFTTVSSSSEKIIPIINPVITSILLFLLLKMITKQHVNHFSLLSLLVSRGFRLLNLGVLNSAPSPQGPRPKLLGPCSGSPPKNLW